MDALNQVGALGTLVISLLGLLLPKAAARFVGLQPLTPAGRPEFEATYGARLRAGLRRPAQLRRPLAFLG
ncbi:MAG: hypothetical protein IM671_13970 [Phenylobacterium sp.]|uniref:hypothetical protein n=1 Tax=Phenylobacterium sp. TaxID=1871053 RepID=UPI0025D844EC|nr:hypothetical protein [Phenylobacterium sp.]MCA6237128.1 hypothetical protein [Phenylobacterium sp.]MCA6247816.1 hypothetical protein [Phenylobacterium sp.]